jgi:serine/threonine-protein kinase
MARVADSNLTRTGATVGTLNYMSPEQIRGTQCTAASDVFSAGIVFFQLSSGRHPFSSREYSLSKVVSAIVFEPPPKLSEICPDAPEGLEFLLNKALEKDAVARFQNGGALKQAVMLCRLTMDMAAAPTPAVPAAAPAAVGATPPPVAEAPVARENQKTQVIKRDFKIPPVVKPAAPPVPPAPPPAPPRLPDPPTAPRFQYCPSCTRANALTAVVCVGCGIPLGNSPGHGQNERPTQWSLYIAIAIAVLLAITLVVVLIVKS